MRDSAGEAAGITAIPRNFSRVARTKDLQIKSLEIRQKT
jgi:hypothetical protein